MEVAENTVKQMRLGYRRTPLMEHGTDLRSIQKLLGHTSVKTSEVHTHISDFCIQKITLPLDAVLAANQLNTSTRGRKLPLVYMLP